MSYRVDRYQFEAEKRRLNDEAQDKALQKPGGQRHAAADQYFQFRAMQDAKEVRVHHKSI